MARATKQIEVGRGETWVFEASETISSGIVVTLQGGKVRLCHWSESALGVTLMPASITKKVGVIMEGIVQINTTGTGDTSAGSYVIASAGKALVRAAASAMKDDLNLGFALENITRNQKGLIKLVL